MHVVFLIVDAAILEVMWEDPPCKESELVLLLASGTTPLHSITNTGFSYIVNTFEAKPKLNIRSVSLFLVENPFYAADKKPVNEKCISWRFMALDHVLVSNSSQVQSDRSCFQSYSMKVSDT